MSIVVYFLSQYPEVLKRLRAEILERVGSSNRPTYDDIREMKYLRAVLNGEYYDSRLEGDRIGVK